MRIKIYIFFNMEKKEIEDKLIKLTKEKEELNKYINFYSDIDIIEIEDALESYNKKILNLKLKIASFDK